MPNGRMVEASSKLEPWRNAVASYTMVARSRVRGWRPLTGPIEVSMVFTLARPRSHYGTGANTGKLRPSAPLRPDVKPDLDKLARATGDALKMGQAYKDDALVVGFRTLSKHYPEDHSWVADVLHKPGCVIRLWPLTAQGVR
jgi:Holliday junction resolvase RusA-like endonuclease